MPASKQALLVAVGHDSGPPAPPVPLDSNTTHPSSANFRSWGLSLGQQACHVLKFLTATAIALPVTGAGHDQEVLWSLLDLIKDGAFGRSARWLLAAGALGLAYFQPSLYMDLVQGWFHAELSPWLRHLPHTPATPRSAR